MNSAPYAVTQEKPPAVLVFVLGLLMSGSFSIDFREYPLQDVSLSWFLPLVAAWLAQRNGIQVLFSWWPLAFMPRFAFTLWGDLHITFGMWTGTLLLPLIVAVAVDPRLTMPAPEKWLRPYAKWPAIVAFSLLFIVVRRFLDYGSEGEMTNFETSYRTTFNIYPLTALSALIFLCAIRWEALVCVIWPKLTWRAARAVGILGAAIVLFGMGVDLSVGIPRGWGIGVGSRPSNLLVPITCFGLVVCFGVRLRLIFSMLIAGLVIDRLLTLAGDGALGPIQLNDWWQSRNWNMLSESIAAALTGRVFRHLLRHGSFKFPWQGQIATLLLSLTILLVGPSLFDRSPSYYGAALWIIAAIAFAVGVQWREHSLIFVPPLLQFLWLLAAGGVSHSDYSLAHHALANIGMISFPFALCGAFFSVSQQFSHFGQATQAASLTTSCGTVRVADVSELAKIVYKIDRSTTWRSFFVAAVPFIVLWQLFELYGVQTFAQQATDTFGGEPLLKNWHMAAAAVLLTIAPLAFVLWDWIDRQDSLRMLALLSGGLAGTIWWQIFGSLLGRIMHNYFGDVAEGRLDLVGLLAFPLIILGSGVFARTEKRIAPHVFLVASGLIGLSLVAALGRLPTENDVDILDGRAGLVVGLLAFPVILLAHDLLARTERSVAYRIFLAASIFTVALVAVLGWQSMDKDVETREENVMMAASWIISAFIAIAIARFAKLRLLLATDRPRELLFGALRDKGFWPRMAAAAGLPSTLWQGNALHKSAFWALISARFVVYTGGVLFRYWAMAGAAIVALGHVLFYGGKRLGAREIWRPQSLSTSDPPILFLRSFDDDQCDFRRPRWELLSHWLDLWSFRRNLDEAMIDEIAQFGPVVALGRPSDKRTPFGALRHYSANTDWQRTLADAARSAQVIIIVASDSPGVQWEYNLLKSEGMLEKVLLLFRPDPGQRSANRHASEWFHSDAGAAIDEATAASLVPIGMMLDECSTTLFVSSTPAAAAYVLSLRLYFHEWSVRKAATSYETQEEAVQKREKLKKQNRSAGLMKVEIEKLRDSSPAEKPYERQHQNLIAHDKKLFGFVGSAVGTAVILGLVLPLELPHPPEQSSTTPTSAELSTLDIEAHDIDPNISSLIKKAEGGDAQAQTNLGWMYQNGEVVAKDAAKAVEWYRKAAEKGDARAQYNVAWMYQNGEGVPKDAGEAIEWYGKAAEQGYAYAQHNLGVMYDVGNGVSKDAVKAVGWYRKAAEQGYAGAQNNLGTMYEYGEGVPKDAAKAVEWYRKAVEQGNAEAQKNLDAMK